MAIAPTILVTGAAGGRQGATGNTAVRLLRARGIPVRAMVRRDDDRARALRELGAEVVEGDLLNIQAMRSALRGIRRALFVYPVEQGLVEATAIFASAAREARVEQVVNLSQLLSRSGPQPTPHQERHRLSEEIFDWADCGAVHLDATVFYENLRALARIGLQQGGSVLSLPWGPPDTAIPLVCAADVARVAVAILLAPVIAAGTVIPLIGEVLTNRQIAELFASALGHPVRYSEIDPEEWSSRVSGAGISPVALEHLLHLWGHLAKGDAAAARSHSPSEEIRRLTGVPSASLRQFLAENAEFFRGLPQSARR
jgi:uncharacterized protein YbjT (DUF2867 family)